MDRINEVYMKVTEQESYSQKVNEYNMELQKLVSFKSVGFVFLSITVVFIISFLHYLEIKRVLKNRKIIWFVWKCKLCIIFFEKFFCGVNYIWFRPLENFYLILGWKKSLFWSRWVRSDKLRCSLISYGYFMSWF